MEARDPEGGDVVLVCLSRAAINKAGFLQKEIRQVLDVADEQPERVIFAIPMRMEESVAPKRLSRRQWVNLFAENGNERLRRGLRVRASAEA